MILSKLAGTVREFVSKVKCLAHKIHAKAEKGWKWRENSQWPAKNKLKQIINMDCFLLIKVGENCLKIIEKSGNFLLSGEWQPCLSFTRAVVKLLSKASRRLRLLSSVIGLKICRQFFNQVEAKPKPMASCTREFAALWAGYGYLPGILIGSSHCWLLLWLVGVITFVFGGFDSHLKSPP